MTNPMGQDRPPGYWQASDGKWYPDHLHPGYRRPLPTQTGLKGFINRHPVVTVVVILLLALGLMVVSEVTDEGNTLVGKCVIFTDADGLYDKVPCDGPHEGKVVDKVADEDDCPPGSEATLVFEEGTRTDYFCVEMAS